MNDRETKLSLVFKEIGGNHGTINIRKAMKELGMNVSPKQAQRMLHYIQDKSILPGQKPENEKRKKISENITFKMFKKIMNEFNLNEMENDDSEIDTEDKSDKDDNKIPRKKDIE